MEDFALRFTARRARKWSPGHVANTAIGSISFLALEAIGGAITLSYGFENAVAAILVVGAILFLTGLPISYHAATSGVDIDLLTRGAGFGYIGSTVTSLIYASFTFIFFALEAAILSLALELCFGVPLEIGYLLNALIVIPLVAHGFTRIGHFQKWTQPIWVFLQLLPFLLLALVGTDLGPWLSHEGRLGEGGLALLPFAAAAGVVFSLAAQIGEQVDFLRFLPEPRTPAERRRWWLALIAAGPGWAVIGTVKMLLGSFLAVLALEAGVAPEDAIEPTQMYLTAFQSALPWETVAIVLTGTFVIVAQLKINVTNAYAGSIAWSNFFSRLTHSHPGRVVWLCFNVLIALMLMEFGVFGALEKTLGLYAHVAVAWVGALFADLIVNKPLGLSPARTEFRRAYLFDINPVGVGAMALATMVSLAAYLGALGPTAEALSSFIALGTALVASPVIAWATSGRYYIARPPALASGESRCTLCGHAFDREDIVDCPFHGGDLCSLCCSLDAGCNDRCKPADGLLDAPARAVTSLLPPRAREMWQTRYAMFAGIVASFLAVIGAAFLLVHQQVSLTEPGSSDAIARGLTMGFAFLCLVVGVAAWLHVLALESRVRAMRETERQADRLAAEIRAHERTDAELQKAKDDAVAANEAKSRYVIGISHELRTPLNAILGYAQLLEGDPTIPAHRHTGVRVIRRSAEHLGGLIEGLLDISKIEAGRLEVYSDRIRFADCLSHLVAVFRMQAAEKALDVEVSLPESLPAVVRGDEKRLRQILMNLLSNAVRYTDSGTVRFAVTYRSDTAEFVVSDTGRGIPEAELERIFQPFERLEDPERPVPGTGLGLTITRLLTDMLGGELTLESTAGEGSVFRVRLRLPMAHGESAAPAAESHGTRWKGYLGPRRRILVVDDNAEHRALIGDLLRPLGFEVAFAETAEAALAMVGALSPDMALVDVALPGMDGWALIECLREDHALTCPIVMVSAHALEKRFHESARKLHDAFIAKPIRIDALLATIGDVLALTWSDTETAHVDTAPAAVDPGVLSRLVAAADINHAAGVRDALDALEANDPALAAEGRRLLERFDFAAIAKLAGSRQSPETVREQPE